MAVETYWPMLLAAATLAVAFARLPWRLSARMSLAAVAFSLAAAGMSVSTSKPPTLGVFVDASAGMRISDFRNQTAVAAFVRRVTGRDDFTIVTFGENAAGKARLRIGDLDAAIVFTDGRIELEPTPAQIAFVFDPKLDEPADARVDSVRLEPGRAIVKVTTPRAVGVQINGKTVAKVGSGTHTFDLDAGVTEITVRVDSNDGWPENDLLDAAIVPRELRRFWVGRNPPAGFTSIDFDNASDNELLGASIVAGERFRFDNVARLDRFVRELGGSVLLLNPEGHRDPKLDAISPLVFDPPEPRRQWVFLIDASGSMSREVFGTRAIDLAITETADAIERLPPADRVKVGTFARDLTWRIDAGVRDAAAEVRTLRIEPLGPTNLESTLATLAASANALPTTAIVLTDGSATIADVDGLAGKLRAAAIELRLVRVGESKHDALDRFVAATGGKESESSLLDFPSLIDLVAQRTAGRRARESTTSIEFEFESIRTRIEAKRSSAAWLRDGATPIATAADGLAAGAFARVGLGRIVTLAFEPDETLLKEIIAAIERTPSDDRIRPEMIGDRLVVRASDGTPLNQLDLKLVVDDRTRKLEQVAPGRYEVALDRSSRPRVGRILLGDGEVGRVAIPARHAAEFDAVGNDHAGLESLAKQSGGEVKSFDSDGRIEFRSKSRMVRLDAVFLLFGLASAAWMIVAARVRKFGGRE